MMEVTVNGRTYTKRGQRWTYEPRNNHGRKEVFRGSRLHHALEHIAFLEQMREGVANTKTAGPMMYAHWVIPTPTPEAGDA